MLRVNDVIERQPGAAAFPPNLSFELSIGKPRVLRAFMILMSFTVGEGEEGGI